MHFTKFITAFIVVAATSAFASPSFRHESAELTGAGGMDSMDMEGSSFHHHGHGHGDEGGSRAFDSSDAADMAAPPAEQFSEAPESSLQTASRMYCWYGRCLHRHYRWRRCPWGSRPVRYVWCGRGYWWIRAVCCRYRHCLTGAADEAERERINTRLSSNDWRLSQPNPNPELSIDNATATTPQEPKPGSKVESKRRGRKAAIRSIKARPFVVNKVCGAERARSAPPARPGSRQGSAAGSSHCTKLRIVMGGY
ncbi:hypothetical protein BJ912DRAFT_1059425 [Pholiota molesta]|nr:hypothetical protein BJ912DRAFT_1059425 [Pholiota molesta]